MTSAFRANFLTQQKEILNAWVPCCHLGRPLWLFAFYTSNNSAVGTNMQNNIAPNFPLAFGKRSENLQFFWCANLHDFTFAIEDVRRICKRQQMFFYNVRSWINVHSICLGWSACLDKIQMSFNCFIINENLGGDYLT